MGNIMNAWNSALGAVNVVSNGVESGLENQAKFDLSTMQINLQREANVKMLEIEQNSNWEDWEKNIDDYFTKVTSSMTDRNSKFYCRNNLTARMATEMIESARNQYQNRAAQKAVEFQQQKNAVDFNDKVNGILEMYSGQDAYDQCLVALDQFKQVNKVSPQQEENMRIDFWQRSVTSSYDKYYSSIKDSAVAAGKSAEEVWNDMDSACKDTVRSKDSDGLPKPNYGSGEYRQKLKSEFIQKYNADQAKYMTDNYNMFSDDIVDIRGDIIDLKEGRPNAKSYESISLRITRGHTNLENTGKGQLATGKKDILSKEYDALTSALDLLEKQATSSSSSSKSANAPSFESIMLTKGFTETFLMQIENGTFHDSYAAVTAMSDELKKEWFTKDWKEQKVVENGVERQMTNKEKVEYYNSHFRESAAHDLLNSDVLEKKLETNYPSIYLYYKDTIKDIEKDTVDYLSGKTKVRKYSEEAATYLSNFIHDAMAGAGRDTNSTDLVKLFNVQLKAVRMDGLNGLFKTKKIGENQEKYLARTADELRDNDILITDDYRNTMEFAPGTEEKVKAIATDQRNFIAGKLGVDLDNDWTYVATRNDRQPIPVFTDKDGNKYIVQSAKNGKEVEIVDENGNVYEQLTNEARKEEYKDQLAVNYGDMAVQKEKIKEMESEKKQELIDTVTNMDKLPTLVKEFGDTDESVWNGKDYGPQFRYHAIQNTIAELNRLAKKKKYSDAEFKKKTGLTKQEWLDLKSEKEKIDYISKS